MGVVSRGMSRRVEQSTVTQVLSVVHILFIEVNEHAFVGGRCGMPLQTGPGAVSFVGRGALSSHDKAPPGPVDETAEK